VLLACVCGMPLSLPCSSRGMVTWVVAGIWHLRALTAAPLLPARLVHAHLPREQVSEEEHSDNYRRGVPSRREGLLSMIGGGAAEGESNDDGHDDGTA
jgi:hypothetical protein